MTTVNIELFFDTPQKSLQLKIDGQCLKMYKLFRDDKYEQYTPDLAQPAVYILFGGPLRTGGRKLYIGQTGNASRRMNDHKIWKGFWQFACVFVNICQKFTPTDTQYLEYALIKRAMESGQSAMVENCQIPKKPACQEEYAGQLDQFVDLIADMLQIVGLNPFGQMMCSIGDIDKHTARTVAKRVAKQYTIEYERVNSVSEPTAQYGGDDDDEYSKMHYLHKDGQYDAMGMWLSGARVYIFHHGCIAPPNGGSRDDDIKNAIAAGQVDGNTYALLKDMIFNTPDEAEKFITGQPDTGRWHPPFGAVE